MIETIAAIPILRATDPEDIANLGTLTIIGDIPGFIATRDATGPGLTPMQCHDRVATILHERLEDMYEGDPVFSVEPLDLRKKEKFGKKIYSRDWTPHSDIGLHIDGDVYNYAHMLKEYPEKGDSALIINTIGEGDDAMVTLAAVDCDYLAVECQREFKSRYHMADEFSRCQESLDNTGRLPSSPAFSSPPYQGRMKQGDSAVFRTYDYDALSPAAHRFVTLGEERHMWMASVKVIHI